MVNSHLLTANNQQPTAYSQQPVAYSQQPTEYCQQLTANCLILNKRVFRMIQLHYRYFQFLFYFTAVMFIFSSCKTTQPTTRPPAKPPTTVTQPKTDPKKEEEKIPDKDEVVKMNFALVMPFELRENFAPVTDDMAEPLVSPSSLQALNFYEGALMAVDTLVPHKRDVMIRAYEAPSDSAAIGRMFSNVNLKSANYVIGTFPNHLVPAAASLAKKHKINLVITQASSPDFLEDNEHVVLSMASTLSQCREMVTAMLKLHPGANVILVYRKMKREDELAEAFRSQIEELKSGITFHDIRIADNGIEEVTSALTKTKRNVVFVVSSDEAFVNPLLSKIEEQNLYGIVVSGLPTWQYFESIDFMNFQNIKVHIFDNNYIDYDDFSTSLLRSQFLKRFYNDPLPSAYHGFNMIYNLALQGRIAAGDFKKSINSSFNKQDKTFRFEEYGEGGLENKSITVLKFTDYKMEKVQVKW